MSLSDYKDAELPSIELFYSSLNDESYQMLITSLRGRYGKHSDVEVYLKIDVVLLVGVFENFRSLSLQAYKLDPARLYSLIRLD